MGFVGGSSKIAIATALPPSLFVYCIVNIKIVYGFSLSHFLWLPEASVYGCGDKPWPHRPVPAVCRILCSNVQGLAGNLSDLIVALSPYDILLCSETLVSNRHHVSEVLIPGFRRPLLLCQGKMPRARGMAAYVRDGYGAFRQPKFESGCCEMLVFGVCGVRQNLCVQPISQP